jgi:hypothetical protein
MLDVLTLVSTSPTQRSAALNIKLTGEALMTANYLQIQFTNDDFGGGQGCLPINLRPFNSND